MNQRRQATADRERRIKVRRPGAGGANDAAPRDEAAPSDGAVPSDDAALRDGAVPGDEAGLAAESARGAGQVAAGGAGR